MPPDCTGALAPITSPALTFDYAKNGPDKEYDYSDFFTNNNEPGCEWTCTLGDTDCISTTTTGPEVISFSQGYPQTIKALTSNVLGYSKQVCMKCTTLSESTVFESTGTLIQSPTDCAAGLTAL